MHLVQRLPQMLTRKSRDALWTHAAKHILGDLGKNELGYYVCCSGYAHKNQGEWLLDLIWMDTDSWAITLAVESEWGKVKAIKEDFGKLLCIKVPQKLMLVNTESHEGRELIRSELKDMLVKYPYHLLGEEYLLLECTDEGAYRYVFRITEDGPAEGARWEELSDLPLRWDWGLRSPCSSSSRQSCWPDTAG